jgi:parvulin-like peptidyl-prolyl isomerase
MANQPKRKIVTKKHMARQEREERQTRFIIYGSIAIVAIVIILVGIALLDIYVLTPDKPVAVVNGDKISTSDYQARAKFERLQLVNQFASTLQLMQSFDDESTLQYFQSSLQQIGFQLTPDVHGQSVLDNMIDDTIIQQQADQLNISVSESELDEYIANAFGYYPSGTPTPIPTIEGSPTQVSPSDDIPTPTVYTEDAFLQNYKDALDGYKQSINISEAQFRNIVRTDILRSKMMDEISKDTAKEEEQVRASHILVDSEEEAQEVIERLDAGEDFAELAIELSTDTGSGANGGDLGWFGRGRMVPEFEEVAFNIKINEISDPVQSDFGWHIIKKIGQEVRPIDESTFNQLQQNLFSEWLTNQRIISTIDTDDTWGEVYPETPVIPQEYQALLGQ